MPSTSSNKAQGCLPPHPGYLSLENATYLVQSFKPFDDKQQHTLYTWGGAGGGGGGRRAVQREQDKAEK